MTRYLTDPAGRGAAKIYAPRSRPRGAFSGPESAAKLRPYRAVLYLLLALALLCAEGQHAPAADNPSAAPAPRAAKPTREISFGERALININNISMWFQRDGLSAHNPLADIAGVTYPRSTGTVVYQDGLVWGGRILDGGAQQVRVGGQTFRSGTVPGRILSRGRAQDRDDPRVRIYRVRRDFRSADLRLDTAELLGLDLSEVGEADVAQVRQQYAEDWRQWPWEWGAPFYDADGDGAYDPDLDEPAFRSADCSQRPETCAANADQIAFFIINDLDAGATTALYGSQPIGLEVQVTLWAYARTDPLGDAIFKKFKIIYKGTTDTPDQASIQDLYFAQWADPDIGDFGDDFAGADTSLSLAYGYNAEAVDSRYQAFDLAPPAVGYDFLQGPIVAAAGAEAVFDFARRPGYRNLPMTSFVYFASGSAISDPQLGEYSGTLEWYNLLRGFQPQPDLDNPVPYANPLTGEDTSFALDGDPVLGTGWNDGIPLPAADRRLVLSTGPVHMALGDTQEVVVALLGGSGSDPLRSVSSLKFNDRFVQEASDTFFDVPAPPAAPSVRAHAGDRSITLDWGHDLEALHQTEEGVHAPFEFEGYNLYQFPGAAADFSQACKIATYDRINGITNILGLQLDDASGAVVNLPLQSGRDTGLRWVEHIDRDACRDSPLFNGQTYYFALTAYSYNTAPDALVQTLESVPQKIALVPQQPPPGRRYQAPLGAALPVEQIRGVGDVAIEARVVNPAALVAATYTITFNPDRSWNLQRDGIPVLENQFNYALDEAYFAVDGVQVRLGNPVFEAPLTFASARVATDANAVDGDLDFWGDGTVFGLADGYARTFWEDGGSDDPHLLGRDLEIRFTGVASADGSEIVAGGSLATLGGIDPGSAERSLDAHPFRPPGAPSSGPFLQRVPFEIWDVEDPRAPRQLNAVIFDRGADGSRDRERAAYHKTYNMTGRDYITVVATAYDSTRIHALTDARTTWMFFFRQGHASVWSTGDVLHLDYPGAIVPGTDAFRFVTRPWEFSREAARQDVARINVFPNPYYGINLAETSRHRHFVTFSHLPQKARIRIFDLAGTLVRTLEKDDPEQFLQWDLLNDGALPVASGVYIAHIEMPDIGSAKVLKLAIVQEQQFLERY